MADSIWDQWHPARFAAAVAAGLVAALLIAATVSLSSAESRADEPPEGVTGFVGGCERFSVFAQNRWDPIGAAARAEPRREAEKVGSFAPNELVPIDGWVRTRPAYPSNTSPWNSDLWFHLADNTGWVAFAAVRADPTTYEPTGRDPDGGRPVPVDEACSGSTR